MGLLYAAGQRLHDDDQDAIEALRVRDDDRRTAALRGDLNDGGMDAPDWRAPYALGQEARPCA